LNIKGNYISSLPRAIGQLNNLSHLDLADNELKELPDSISRLEKLTKLTLTGNNFSEVKQEKIRQWLPNCKIEF